MIDSVKIEEFRALEEKAGKAELEKYAKELGVTLKKSMSFDNMVKALEESFPAPVSKEEVVAPVVEVAPIVEVAPVVEMKLEVAPIVELVPSVDQAIDEVEDAPILQSAHRKMAFDVVGDSYPWAWNMSNVNDSYWFSSIDSAQYAELMSEKESEFKSFIAKLMHKSDMSVVVREPRNSMFVHISPDGIVESPMIYL